MKNKINRINFEAVCRDISRFLENKAELKLFEREIMIQLVENAKAF